MQLVTIFFFFIGFTSLHGVPGEHQEKISKIFTFDAPGGQTVLVIKNIYGTVLVEGIQAKEVSVEVEKTIQGESEANLQAGIREITLGVVHTGDSIILFTDAPYATLKREKGKISYQWNSGPEKAGYEFRFDYAVKVPFGTVVDVSSVNNGEVRIVDTRAMVRASNVNGPVFLERARSVSEASSINGVVECEIIEKPLEDCAFNTINGDMKISFPPDLSADVSWDAMHGDFYTDFDMELLPASVERTTKKTKSGTTFRIQRNPKIRIGDGDVNMHFETINGDMILKKAR